MGKVYLRHLGGAQVFICAKCDAPLTNRDALVSTRFTGATGRAFLFSQVVNLKYSAVQDRMMLTGRHLVRDVSCANCDTKLGWMYEFATEESQRYKEGHVILERALVTETEGYEDCKSGLPSGPRSLLQALATVHAGGQLAQLLPATQTLSSSTQPLVPYVSATASASASGSQSDTPQSAISRYYAAHAAYSANRFV